LIECRKLQILNQKERLVDIQFKLRDSLAIVGESGSGKSLTLKSLIGMLPSNLSLEIEIDAEFELKRGKTVAFIPQNPFTALSPMTKISKQWFGTIKRAEELFEMLNLEWSLFKRYPPELSGGQLQRVIFAMALESEPKLILLDEPTTALDPNLRDEIAKNLVELQSEFGFLMIFVTHDINLASKICRDILVLKDGKVVQSGEAKEVLTNPKDSYTKSLIEANFATREFRK
jgi:peptide/nickel transport system ATP-binding protein